MGENVSNLLETFAPEKGNPCGKWGGGMSIGESSLVRSNLVEAYRKWKWVKNFLSGDQDGVHHLEDK